MERPPPGKEAAAIVGGGAPLLTLALPFALLRTALLALLLALAFLLAFTLIIVGYLELPYLVANGLIRTSCSSNVIFLRPFPVFSLIWISRRGGRRLPVAANGAS